MPISRQTTASVYEVTPAADLKRTAPPEDFVRATLLPQGWGGVLYPSEVWPMVHSQAAWGWGSDAGLWEQVFPLLAGDTHCY